MRRLLPLLLLGACAPDPAALRAERRTLDAERTRVEALNDVATSRIERRAKLREANRIERNPPGYNAAAPLPAGDAARPDIILLSIDTLRADHLSSYGYSRPTSPYLDQLAAGGARFTQAWSPSSWTLPSHTTMLSGLLPMHHGAVEDNLHISSDTVLLQESMKAQGYATGGAVATLFVSQKYGFQRGFDFFHDFGITDPKVNNAATVDAENVFAQALHWAQQLEPGQPVFLFLHVYDAHYAYEAPAPFNTQFDRASRPNDASYRSYFEYKRHPLAPPQLEHQVAQYDEEIAYIDHAFGEFVDAWRKARTATVVVTADHGEEFGERGSWGHAHTLFPEQLHVPLIINGPGVRPAVITDRVGTEDIAPTLSALVGRPMPGDGVDRSAQLRTGAAPGKEKVPAAFAETTRFDTIVYRVHAPPYDLNIDIKLDEYFLCDLSADPACANNLASAQPERVESMKQAWLDAMGSHWQLKQPGQLTSYEGILYVNGERRGLAANVQPGERLQQFPVDAGLRMATPDGQVHGTYYALPGVFPEPTDPAIGWDGRRPTGMTLSTTDAERALLRELGYEQ